MKDDRLSFIAHSLWLKDKKPFDNLAVMRILTNRIGVKQPMLGGINHRNQA
jgi:hypothetical protein